MFFDDELKIKDHHILYVSTELDADYLPPGKVIHKEICKEHIHDTMFSSKTLKRDYQEVVIKHNLVDEIVTKEYNTINIKETRCDKIQLEDCCKIYIRNVEGDN